MGLLFNLILHSTTPVSNYSGTISGQLEEKYPEYKCQNKHFKLHLLFTSLLPLGVEALKKRYLRHVKAPAAPQGERTVQLSIIRKDTTPSGQEELHTESVAVTVKEGVEKPVATKPGMDPRDRHAVVFFCVSDRFLKMLSLDRQLTS